MYSIPQIIETASFEPSRMTVIEGSSGMVPQILFRLCAASAASSREVIFMDGWNSFDPYAVSRMIKSFGGDRTSLSRIHVARAFTEYQMEVLIDDLEPALTRLRLLTLSSGVTTVITSFGGSWYGDRLLAAASDRVIRIERPSKKRIRITDNGHVFEHVPVPPGQK